MRASNRAMSPGKRRRGGSTRKGLKREELIILEEPKASWRGCSELRGESGGMPKVMLCTAW